MAGKSIDYWRNKWDSSCKSNDGADQAWAALELLATYSGFFRTIPIIGLQHVWGGSTARFFKGMWNRHHADEVQAAIENYYHPSGGCALMDEYHKVTVVLTSLKERVGSTAIDPDGDLGRILQVIKEKTNVDYYDLPISQSENRLDS